MDQQLINHRALITGGASGIGFAIAKAFAQNGADIALADINEQALHDASNMLHEYGTSIYPILLDISDIESFSSKLSKLTIEFGNVDILVNNAGVTATVPLLEMTAQEWDRVMNINLRGTFFLTQQLLPTMIQQQYGRIINLGSISGERGAKYAGAHYSISKAGIIMLTKVLAKYLTDSGVTANTISPGIIETAMTQALGTQIDPNDVPMNRMGTPNDIAQTAVFLASDAAGYITGQNISVNGGQSMR